MVGVIFKKAQALKPTESASAQVSPQPTRWGFQWRHALVTQQTSRSHGIPRSMASADSHPYPQPTPFPAPV